ncbi:MAG: PorT family protein [Prevotella sp.]|nr:PorT family protein [Prevotella sp.]
MKRTFLAAALAALCVVSAQAQDAAGSFSLKPMVGGTLTSLVGQDTEATKMKVGLVGGAELSYQVSPQFAISGGALYAMQGCHTHQSFDPKIKLHYLNIPLLANYYVAKGLAIKAGVQPGFLLGARESGWHEGARCYVNVDELFNTFDMAIPIGISYEYKHFVIDARYCFGLTKMAKESNRYEDVSSYLPYDDPNRGYTIQPLGFRGTNVRNSVFMLTVGYNISL